MLRSPRVVAGALVLILIAAVVLTVASAKAASSTCWSYRDRERVLAQRLNKVRSAHELGALRLDPELSRVARAHTKQMVRKRTLFHTPAETLGKRVTNWLVLGENVGAAGGVRRIVRKMMSSEAHAANVLFASYEHVGIGAERHGGRLWATVTFEAERDPGTTLWMPRC